MHVLINIILKMNFKFWKMHFSIQIIKLTIIY